MSRDVTGLRPRLQMRVGGKDRLGRPHPSKRALMLEDGLKWAISKELARHGVTPERGVPTKLSDGVHVYSITQDEIDSVVVEQAETRRTHLRLLAVHVVSVATGYGPTGELIEGTHANFGSIITVEDGHAIGYLLLYEDGLAGREIVRPPVFDSVGNVWVATEHRGRGIARTLLERARAEYPVSKLLEPFSDDGAGWIKACAPDLYARSLVGSVLVGRNDPCPCGSGVKFKRCCLAQEAIAAHEKRIAS